MGGGGPGHLRQNDLQTNPPALNTGRGKRKDEKPLKKITRWGWIVVFFFLAGTETASGGWCNKHHTMTTQDLGDQRSGQRQELGSSSRSRTLARKRTIGQILPR